MKRFAVLLLIFAYSPLPAAAQYGCGPSPPPPPPPPLCERMEPTCVCTADGRCVWQFICIRR